MIENVIFNKVEKIYGKGNAISITQDILGLINKWKVEKPIYQSWVDEKTSYLITYGDSFSSDGEKTLSTMKKFADKYLKNIISNIHILPMFPYTSDDGFSVVDYRKIDPKLGSWQELNALSDNFDLMYDCVINHISKSSDWFQRYLAGDEQYQEYFIESDPSLNYSSVTRPRSLPLLTPFNKASGEISYVWTTFSDDQIDINFHNPKVLLESIDILLMYAANGGRSIRLDAIGFIWKILETSCIHLPQAHEIIQLWRIILDKAIPGTLLITETNVPHRENISYFGQGNEAHMVYQFPLPPLTLHAFMSENSQMLTMWAKGLTSEAMQSLHEGHKTTYFNFLASHDGIGVRPTEGILTNDDRLMMCKQVERKGGRVNYKDNGDGTQSPYELNINYLSALTEPDDNSTKKSDKFLAAQSILLSFIGVPAIYYHSLLGSENDVKAMLESGINRRINREKFNLDELETELEDSEALRYKVYNQMVSLLGLRQQLSAFSPQSSQKVLELGEGIFALIRGEGEEAIRFIVNITSSPQDIYLDDGGVDVITNASFSNTFTLKPYQFVWLMQQ
ncbi:MULTISPECIES: sugar phosphorylase [Aliivibrio]|uniref:sugar phosphorylase n=1 Tax=Aliivibrio TaxID=511678 RepID=UPI000317FDA8|nr:MULTISPECIES: sugar phosphorylase [Aliivibrio]MBD1568679.1 sugar phosphorylase [Aliivibrio sp. S10_S31]MUH97801.1 sugar phosphorylase [Aliivibrio fischeri]MUI63250.1 sugar phosphorylase [Aliivibrio fischeri]OCH04754.1 sugar phosphorylase [Aliivibrio fischeri]OCH59177.1 sugar phosphorylase [Aliivibrio fischeri]